MPAQESTVTSVTPANANQRSGATPPKRGTPVSAMITETIRTWNTVVSTGISRMETAGTPLIL